MWAILVPVRLEDNWIVFVDRRECEHTFPLEEVPGEGGLPYKETALLWKKIVTVL